MSAIITVNPLTTDPKFVKLAKSEAKRIERKLFTVRAPKVAVHVSKVSLKTIKTTMKTQDLPCMTPKSPPLDCVDVSLYYDDVSAVHAISGRMDNDIVSMLVARPDAEVCELRDAMDFRFYVKVPDGQGTVSKIIKPRWKDIMNASSDTQLLSEKHVASLVRVAMGKVECLLARRVEGSKIVMRAMMKKAKLEHVYKKAWTDYESAAYDSATRPLGDIDAFVYIAVKLSKEGDSVHKLRMIVTLKEEPSSVLGAMKSSVVAIPSSSHPVNISSVVHEFATHNNICYSVEKMADKKYLDTPMVPATTMCSDMYGFKCVASTNTSTAVDQMTIACTALSSILANQLKARKADSTMMQFEGCSVVYTDTRDDEMQKIYIRVTFYANIV